MRGYSTPSTLKSEVASFSAEQEQMVRMEIGRNILVQNTYGRITPEDIPTLTASLLDDLKGYPIEKIVGAIAECRKKDDDFITLASLLRKLDPQPEFSRDVYSRLAHKSKVTPGDMWQHEWDYLKKFEENAMKGV